MSVEYYDDSLDSDSNLPQYARITFFDQGPYIMQKERVIIGRNSAAGSVDIDVGAVTFVSRKHLELTYSYQKLKVKCLGKNGIFIDNNFKSHSFIPYELPTKCTLRFPSTDVQFCVEQLVGNSKSVGGIRQGDKSRNNARYVVNDDDSPDYKRIKLDSHSDHDSTSNDNHETGFRGFGDVLCNLTDEEVEEYIHNERDDDDDGRKIGSSECDGLMHDVNEEIDGVLIDNNGSYQFHSNGSNNNISKEYTINNMKSNEINTTNILSGLDNHSSASTRTSVTKLVFNNIRCTNDQYFSNDGQMSVLDQDDLTIEHGSDTQKPPYSYAQLIVQAVSTAGDRHLTLNGIYNYISKNYPYFKAHDKGWQNSVRHNLSLNRYFIKVPRGQDEPGKGSFWRVDPTYENKLVTQAFRKRRLRNNTSSMTNENGNMPQVLSVSTVDTKCVSSNNKLFGLHKSGTVANSQRVANFGNVITLKRASDVNTQNGATTYMLSSGSGLSANGQPQKYVVAGRNTANHNFECHSNVSANKSGSLFKCQTPVSAAATTTNLSTKGRGVQIRSQATNAGTLISLGGKLYSTTNIKSLQLQQARDRVTGGCSPFDSSSNVTKPSSMTTVTATTTITTTDTVNTKTNNSYYIISPSGLRTQRTLSSPPDENQSTNQPLTAVNRRVISIQSSQQSPGVKKVDLSNGNLNKHSQLKNPIIFKKIKINNNFLNVKSSEPKKAVIIDMGGRRFLTGRTCDKSYGDHRLYDDDEIKLEPEGHVFMDSGEMDHFLISHSDPSVVALPPHARSEACSSPDLYKRDDDMWQEDEVTKIESIKYGMHECD